MAKKWVDPIERLIEADQKAQSVQGYLKNISANSSKDTDTSDNQEYHLTSISLIEVDVKNIIRWKYKDRPPNELGDIKELAETFKSVGQQQPCILRLSKEHTEKYELIVGERRWRAAELAGLKLKAIVQDIDDKTAALIQAIENEKRSDISEFAKGISYTDKIEKGLITQKDLVEILGISKQQVTRLLSYKKIPETLFNAIKDFRKVSSRTAYELNRLAHKSEIHLSALIDMADKIREGKYGQKRIERELEIIINKKSSVLLSNKKVIGNDGRHLFTWRLDNNATPSIHFPKDILGLLNENIISFDELTKEFKECIAKKLIDLKN